MEQFLIGSLGKENKSAYSAAGKRYTIPEHLREKVKEGDYMLVDLSEEFTKRTNPQTGELEDCEPFRFNRVSMVGDFETTLFALHEGRINAEVGQAAVETRIVTLKSKFKLAAPTVEEAIGA